MLRTLLLTGFGLSLLGGCATPSNKDGVTSTRGVRISRLDDRLRVEIDGSLFTEDFFKDVPRPYCYPVIGPGEALMTRNWPMKSAPNEEHDHPHHRSLWFAHGSINGHDFWSEEKDFGKTVHESFTKIRQKESFNRGTNG